MLAYCLLPTRRFAKWFLLEGQSRAGKGTILTVLRALIGPTSLLSTDLSHLADKNGLDGAQYATVLSVPEVNTVIPQARERVSAVLKLCLGEDPVTIEAKFKRAARNVILSAVPILSSNEIPILANRSSGLSSKMVPIPFDVSFRGREDIHLKDALLSEIDGIAYRLAIHAARIIALSSTGGQPFALTQRAQARLRLFHMTNNPADSFLSARFIEDEKGRVAYPRLRSLFAHWKKTNNIRMVHIPDNRFGVWLCQNSSWALRTGEWRSDNERQNGILGLSVRAEFRDFIETH